MGGDGRGDDRSLPGGDPQLTDVDVELVVEQLRRRVPGGIGTYCRGLVQGLSSLTDGPRVRLRASRWGGGGTDPLSTLGFPLVTSSLPGPLLTRAWDAGIPLGYHSLGREAVVHGTSFATPSVRSAPLVLTVHDLAWRAHPDAFPPRGRAWHERSLHRLAPRARLIIVPSRLTADHLLDTGARLSSDRVRVIPEGLDHLPPPDEKGMSAALESAGVDAGAPFLLSVATLEPRKNLDRLVEAYLSARPRLPEPWPLVLVGPVGWGRVPSTPPVGVVSTGGVPPAVLSALYRRARVVAYVPLLEGFGLPAGEALACGAVVVATRGLPSCGPASIAVDPYDVEEIADGLVTAACDDAVRAARREEGRRWSARLTWAEAARGHVAVWEEARA